MTVLHGAMQDRVIFIAWEMTLLFRKTRPVVMHGISKTRPVVMHGISQMRLNEAGKIIEQRDYYDLWGTILDHIPGLNKLYRNFMRKVFG